MLDLTLIENTIRELESGETNFAVCDRLASLYIIRDQYNKKETPTEPLAESCSTVKKELSDIIPHYDMYCVLKRQYQLHMIDSTTVLKAFADVLGEIQEFLHTLYSATDTQEERELLITMINTITF